MAPALEGLDAGREALRRFLAGEDTLQEMHERIVALAVEAVPGAAEASITMFHQDRRPITPAATGERARQLDEVQYAHGDGPCLSAARHHGIDRVDTATDRRWPAFSEAALDLGIAESLSAPLVDQEHSRGALNLYSETGFASESGEVASLFADQLGVAAVNAARLVQGVELAAQLEAAMRSRAVIEQAKGILMASQAKGPDAAFDILRETSQHQNRKLHEIAAEIVDRYTDGEPAP